MRARGQVELWGRGLYRIPQLPIGRHDKFALVVIRVGYGAVVSFASAYFLHGSTETSPETIEITVPTTARIRRAGLDGIKIWRAHLAPSEVVIVDGIPTTTVGRAQRDCREVSNGLVVSNSVGEETSISHNRSVERPRVEMIDGKALYDGRSLVAWAARVADHIVECCDASRVILYGSVARGDDGPDSDIDLLVVMPIIGRRHDASVRLLNELRDLPVPIDITVVDPAHLHEEASVPGVVRAAMREGRVLVSA